MADSAVDVGIGIGLKKRRRVELVDDGFLALFRGWILRIGDGLLGLISDWLLVLIAEGDWSWLIGDDWMFLQGAVLGNERLCVKDLPFRRAEGDYFSLRFSGLAEEIRSLLWLWNVGDANLRAFSKLLISIFRKRRETTWLRFQRSCVVFTIIAMFARATSIERSEMIVPKRSVFMAGTIQFLEAKFM